MICRWFAKCGNETTLGNSHPVLGVVPICDRCATLLAITPDHKISPCWTYGEWATWKHNDDSEAPIGEDRWAEALDEAYEAGEDVWA